MGWKNRLYFGDNLKILRDYVATDSVDLIYLDPPFNSSATYVLPVAPIYERRRRRSQTGATVPSAVCKEIVTSGPRKLADLMQALLAFLGQMKLETAPAKHPLSYL